FSACFSEAPRLRKLNSPGILRLVNPPKPKRSNSRLPILLALGTGPLQEIKGLFIIILKSINQ
ncbi:hypothetical protein EBS67_10575, partial [bacterium]|nr:hypothetical protein [bacterium]